MLFSGKKDQLLVIGRGRCVAEIANELDVPKASVLKHQDQLILAIVIQLLGVNFFREQRSVPPQPGAYLARGDVLQGIGHNGPGRDFQLRAVGQTLALSRFWPCLGERPPVLRQP